MVEVLDAHPQAWQLEVLEQYDHRSRRISIRSGHGVGKSTVLAWMMLHHILCRFPQKTAVTAPTEKQLFDALWAEFRTWANKLPPLLRQLIDVRSDRCELLGAPSESFITLKTSRVEQPDAMQGVHADWVLLIADEASGVPEQVFEAAMGSMSGHNAVTILAGNPVRAQGFFYDTHSRLADSWWTRCVPCAESPYVSADYAAEVARSYGEHSNAYRVRVLGEFPTTDDDTVVPFALVEAARHRDVTVAKTAPVVWGVDCARFGSDRSALAKRQSHVLLEPVKSWRKLDTMELAGRLKLEYDQCPAWLRPVEINVDAIGIGAGVVDRLRQLGLPVRGVNVSESPAATNADRYANLRAELWFAAAEWFAKRDCRIPDTGADTDVFIRELVTPKYRFRPGSGKVFVESKDDLKRRGMPSPDLADAFVLTFASNAVTLLHGQFASTSWNHKLSAPLKGLV